MFAHMLDGVLDRCDPIALAFIDGHHKEELTLRYSAQVADHLPSSDVGVFDDIRWSEGMERAWSRLLGHPAVTVAIDLDNIGVCVVRASDSAPRVHRLSRITSMQKRVSDLLPG